MKMTKFSVFMLCLTFTCSVYGADVQLYDLLMPAVEPYRDELYLCTTIMIDPHSSYSIVGFVPNATMHTAHHMLLYGCTEPGLNEQVWDCGEMSSNNVGDAHEYNTGPPCSAGSQIVYAWARDAPELILPDDVGFIVGSGSPIKHLVLQIHYMHKFPPGKTDSSGLYLKYTREVTKRQAGVILLATDGFIPASSTEHMETACPIKENKVIHPFAYRTHTHTLGKVVSGYVVRNKQGEETWQLLGKRDPLTPQMFYSTFTQDPISVGDVLAARCTMVSHRDHDTHIGSTNKDEMCNFYLMYWVENGTPLEQKYCYSDGPPLFYWNQLNFKNIPDIEASTL